MEEADQPMSPRRTQSRRWWCAVLAVALLGGGAVLSVSLGREVVSAPAADGHHDFLAFHSAAEMITRGTPAQLYDPAAITALERGVIATPVGAAGYMPYISPPFAAAVQSPLGFLTEPQARVVWLLISLPLALLCCWMATAGMRRLERVVAAVCLAATFPFYQALVEGQWSFVMLAGCLVATRALRSHRPLVGGVALAVLALKPPLLIPVLIVLLCARAWRVTVTVLLTVAMVWLVTLPWTGLATQADYAGYLVAVLGSHLAGAGAAGATVWQGGIGAMEGVNGLVAGYVGQRNVALVDAATAVLVAAVAVRWGMAARRVGLSFAGPAGRRLAVAGIAAALLADLHLYPQDCVLLVLAVPWLLRMVAARDRLLVVLLGCVALDAVWLDQLSVTTHVLAWVLGAGVVWGTRVAVAESGSSECGRPAGIRAATADR